MKSGRSQRQFARLRITNNEPRHDPGQQCTVEGEERNEGAEQKIGVEHRQPKQPAVNSPETHAIAPACETTDTCAHQQGTNRGEILDQTAKKRVYVCRFRTYNV